MADNIEAVEGYRIGNDLYILLLGILRGIQIKQQRDKTITWETEIDTALKQLKGAHQIDALYPNKEEIEARERLENLLQVHAQIKYYFENSEEPISDLWAYLASLEGELYALKGAKK